MGCCRCVTNIKYKFSCFLNSILGQDSDLAYQFELRSMELCRLCIIWERKVRPLPGVQDLHSWGPSEEEKTKCIEKEFSGGWDEDERESEVNDELDDEGWQDDDDEMEGEFLESLEALALSDEWRAEGQDDMFYLGQEFSTLADTYRRTSMSPRKRTRDV